jgi:hypothetical protein
MSRSSARAGWLVVCVLLAIGPGARTVEGSEPDTPPTADASQAPAPEPPAQAQRPAILPPLYASFGALEMLDAHSTLEAMSAGAVEVNRSMAGLAAHPAALVAVKAATTAGTILLSEQLWRRNRVAAVLLMVSLNGAYAAVVAHNYSVARAAP